MLTPTITVTEMRGCTMVNVRMYAPMSLEGACTALAEQGNAAAHAVLQWADIDCEWFVPGPSSRGFPVADFQIQEGF